MQLPTSPCPKCGKPGRPKMRRSVFKANKSNPPTPAAERKQVATDYSFVCLNGDCGQRWLARVGAGAEPR